METRELNHQEIMDRFNWIREDQGLSLRKFCDTLGVTKSVTDNIIYKRVERVSHMYINLLCDKLDVKKEWILYGEGEPYIQPTPEEVEFTRWVDEIAEDLSPNSRELMSKINQLSENDLRLVNYIVNRFLNNDDRFFDSETKY